MAKLTDHIEEEQSRQDYSSYVVKLLWRVIGKIDPDKLSFTEKEAIEDILQFSSVAEIAKRRHVSETKVRQQINDALKIVSDQIDHWIKMMRINEKLKEDNKELKATIRSLQRSIDRLESQTEIAEPEPEPESESVQEEQPRYSFYAVPVSDELNKKLTLQITSLALPADIKVSLQRQGIFSVFDLVSLSRSEFDNLYGLYGGRETTLRKCIENLGLQFYMPVYYDEERKVYMM